MIKGESQSKLFIEGGEGEGWVGRDGWGGCGGKWWEPVIRSNWEIRVVALASILFVDKHQE